MITLETAPLIESNGFIPNATGAEMALFAASEGTLESALRQLGASEAPAAEPRGEMLFDLFVDARSGYRAEGAERSAHDILASTSWRGLLIQDDSDSSPDAGARGMKDMPLRAAFDDVDGDGKEDEPIVVKGERPKTMDDDSGGDTGGGYGDGGYPGGTPGGGGGTESSITKKVADHTQDCGTEDGAAVQVAKHVMGTPPGAGPPNPLTTPSGSDWTRVEFGAVITRGPDGRYGTLNDSIYSNDAFNFVVLPISGDNIEGIWHNHTVQGDANQQLVGRYPSNYADGRSDWTALQSLKDNVAPNDPGYDPSLWLTGPDGVTREFKLSERAYYENLTDAQMQAGEGLNGKERTQSCG
jgi:hypothetical protein